MTLPGFRGVKLWPFARRRVAEVQQDAVTDAAAQLSYYLLFAL